VAGPLSQDGAQLACRTVTIGDEARVAAQPLDQPFRADPAGAHVARKMHAAHHALLREARGTLEELLPALGHHVGQ
jgi:hypothetical protein